jgi:hypothetical protein
MSIAGSHAWIVMEAMAAFSGARSEDECIEVKIGS